MVIIYRILWETGSSGLPRGTINDSYTTNHSIKFVNSGYEEYLIQGRFQRLGRGEIMLVNTERSVSVESTGDSIAVFIENELINEILASLSVRFSGSGNIIYKNHIQRIGSKDFNMIWWTKVLANPDVVLTEGFFYETGAPYITSFITDWDVISRIECKNEITATATKGKLQKAKMFIFDHIETNISLKEVAEQAALSRFSLIRRFKQIYGFTSMRLHTPG